MCYVIFTLSGGLGFLDATLSLFAINTVTELDSLWERTCPSFCVLLIVFCLPLRQFSLSPASVGLIMLGLSLPYCLASPLLGFFTDKYPVSLSTYFFFLFKFFVVVMFHVSIVDVH